MARIKVAHRKAIEDYLKVIMPTLKLSHWHIELLDEAPQNSGASATTRSRSGQRTAGLWIGDRFFDDDVIPDPLRTQTLIHELLHLHFEEAWRFADDVFENELGRQARDMATHTFCNKMEVPVDQLAYVLADFLPVFKLPK